ncbi:MAG: CTP synthase [Patescibacteria group bacterium]
MRKFIFVSGGVISGIGKGITTASIGRLLQAKGYRVTAMKIDMYLNIDAGTIRPAEHGEVFVTEDGVETDQDLGNYERFLETNLARANYCTTGQVYAEVLRKERAFDYDGEDVEAIPHVTDEIIRRVEGALEENKAEIVLIELGGTVGEYQNALFFEAARIMKLRAPDDVVQVHVGYLPIPTKLGEMKSKPVQQSVKLLNSMGIQPDLIIGRADVEIDERRRERLALFCNVRPEDVISNPDVDSIYEIPLIFEGQKVAEKLLEKLHLPVRSQDLQAWRDLVRTIQAVTKPVKIAIVGKYFTSGDFLLSDVYISVIEALKHAAWGNKLKLELEWVDSLQFEKDPQRIQLLKMFDGIVVPGGFGSRGIDGILRTIQFVREEKIPYLGLCYGLQLAVIEFARHKAGLAKAHTTEIDEKSPHPVIHVMPDQEKKLLERNYGATMRLGAWPCKVLLGTQAYQAYFGQTPRRGQQTLVSERHRHRYEVNNAYRSQLEKAGLVFSGLTPDGQLVEIIELPAKDHPFFVASQFHPEFQSRPLHPHPLFRVFMAAAAKI